MKCEKAKEVFSEYLEGTIEPPLAVALRNHLSECSECRFAYAQFEAAWQVLNSMPAVEVPTDFHNKLMERVEASRAVRLMLFGVDWRAVLTTRIPVRTFAAVVALTVFAAMTIFIAPQGGKVGPVLSPGPIMETPSAKRVFTNMQPGLQIAVERQSANNDLNVYDIVLRLAPGVKIVWPAVYVVPEWNGSIDDLRKKAHSPVFQRTIRSDEEFAVPVVVEHSDASRQPITVYVAWTHEREQFDALIFLPRQRTSSPLVESSSRGGTDIFEALRTISAHYAAVIVADGNLNAEAPAFQMSGTAEKALGAISGALPVKWIKVGHKIYVVEPR